MCATVFRSLNIAYSRNPYMLEVDSDIPDSHPYVEGLTARRTDRKVDPRLRSSVL